MGLKAKEFYAELIEKIISSINSLSVVCDI
jgi:hypothetical protein